MKKIAIIIAATALALGGCNDFLDEKPADRLLEDEAYGTLNDLWLNGVAGLYREVGGNTNGTGLQGTVRGVYDLNTFSTDEAFVPKRGADWYDGGVWQSMFLHNNAGADCGDAWNYLLRQVHACNASLEHIDAYAAAHPNDNVAPLRAEVTALRAMFRFYAMDLFGRLPLFNSSKPSTDELHLQPRSTVYRAIVDDLTGSLDLLSHARSNYPGEYYGRVTQPVALFLLAKLMLNAEVYADDDWTDGKRPSGKDIMWNVNGETVNSWQACAIYCDEIGNHGYELELSQSACFAVRNEFSVENIFTIPMDRHLLTNEFWNLVRSRHYKHGAALGLEGENGPCATRHALEVFGYGTDEVDPRFHSTYYAGEMYDLDGDPILLDDGTPLVYYPDKVELDLSDSPYIRTAGARMAKYEVDLHALKDGKLSDNDIVLMRYADVLLMHCEALLRQGGNDELASALLNTVRARVGAPGREATLDNVLDERLLELAWEGWRRNDLIRFNRWGAAITDRPALPVDADGHTIVYPIPGETLTVTGDAQNPGF